MSVGEIVVVVAVVVLVVVVVVVTVVVVEICWTTSTKLLKTSNASKELT